MTERSDLPSSRDLIRRAKEDLERQGSATPLEPPDSPGRSDAPMAPIESDMRPPSERFLRPDDSIDRTRSSPPTPAPRAEPPGPWLPEPTGRRSSSGRTAFTLSGLLILVALTGLLFGIFRNEASGPVDGGLPATTVVAEAGGGEAVPGDWAVSYPDFSSADGLNLVGTATRDGTVISLTRKQEGLNQSGAIWTGERIPVADGFETVFTFQIEHVSWWTIGDGFAFVIQNASSRARGEGASGNGYQDIPNSLAIEFDTVYHSYVNDPRPPIPAPDPPDLLGNHVSVHTMGTDLNTSRRVASTGHAGLPILLAERRPHVALITYVPGDLAIYIDGSSSAVLRVDVDLEETLELTDGSAYVGFTAGTEPGFYADHRIIRWVLGSPCMSETCSG